MRIIKKMNEMLSFTIESPKPINSFSIGNIGFHSLINLVPNFLFISLLIVCSTI
jgi:hypothetical protein